MVQKPTNQPVASSPEDEDEPTMPRMAAQRFPRNRFAKVLQARQNGTFRVAIDEQGCVCVTVPRQGTYVLQPEEAYELLDFLFEYRNLLAARSAEIAEQ